MMRVLCALFVIAGLLPAQCLTTTFAGGNGQSGNMFDVIGVGCIEVTGVEVNLDLGTYDVEVWTKTGTHVGFEGNPGAWTALGTAVGVVSNGPGVATPLALPLSVPINAGERHAFYITVVGVTAINYTNGSAFGSVTASDSGLQILEGAGVAYPFGPTFGDPVSGTSRIWNGTLCYVNGSPPPGTLGVPGYNDLTVNGQGSGQRSCVSTNIAPGPGVLSMQFDALPNSPIVMSLSNQCDVEEIVFDACNSVDVEITQLQIFVDGTGVLMPPSFINSQARTLSNGIWALALTVQPPPPGLWLALQGAPINAAYALGFAESQAFELTVLPPVVTTSYTLPDDGFQQHALVVPVAFYGVTYNHLYVNSNGYVTFGGGSSDFTETLPEFFNGFSAQTPGVAAYYSDLNRGGAGSGATYDVTEDLLTNTVLVEFNNQVHWSSSEPAGTFSVEFGAAITGSVHIDYSGFIPGLVAIDNGIIGITDGTNLVGADVDVSDGAGTGFANLVPTFWPVGSSIGELIPANTAIGVTTLTFDPIGGNWVVN